MQSWISHYALCYHTANFRRPNWSLIQQWSTLWVILRRCFQMNLTKLETSPELWNCTWKMTQFPTLSHHKNCQSTCEINSNMSWTWMRIKKSSEKVEEHTDWCFSLAFSIKSDGSLRVCLDPAKLNKMFKRCPHEIPTLEELTHKFSGAKFFFQTRCQSWILELLTGSRERTSEDIQNTLWTLLLPKTTFWSCSIAR